MKQVGVLEWSHLSLSTNGEKCWTIRSHGFRESAERHRLAVTHLCLTATRCGFWLRAENKNNCCFSWRCRRDSGNIWVLTSLCTTKVTSKQKAGIHRSKQEKISVSRSRKCAGAGLKIGFICWAGRRRRFDQQLQVEVNRQTGKHWGHLQRGSGKSKAEKKQNKITQEMVEVRYLLKGSGEIKQRKKHKYGVD